MHKKLLGIRICEHDSNISYFDGEIVRYYKSERNKQIKHHGYDNVWEWKNDIEKLWNMNVNDVDEIAIVFDPWRHKLPCDNHNLIFDPVENKSPIAVEDFYPAIEYKYFPSHCKVYRVNHHLAHALSCWPIQKSRPEYEVIIDGVGDNNNAWTVIRNDKMIKRGYKTLHGSLGYEMCRAGEWLGIKCNNGDTMYNQLDIAGKAMALQAYGELLPFMKYKLNHDMYSINKLFDRQNFFDYIGDELVGHLKPLDWIRTIHDKVSDILIEFFEDITDKNYNASISYSGGVAQNVIWNTALKNKFPNLVIPPHCNDEGLSLGALEYLRVKNNLPPFSINNFPFCQSDVSPSARPAKSVLRRTAELLEHGKVVGWYQGHGEIGPRALGHRSILFNPLIDNAKHIVNEVKKRENYRPFGASIMYEYQKEYFNTDIYNPYMQYIGYTQKDELSSITHIDGSCRYQTVDKGIFYELHKEFYKLTDCPVLLNTSLNVNGKPILGTWDYNSWKQVGLDAMIVGNNIYE